VVGSESERLPAYASGSSLAGGSSGKHVYIMSIGMDLLPEKIVCSAHLDLPLAWGLYLPTGTE